MNRLSAESSGWWTRGFLAASLTAACVGAWSLPTFPPASAGQPETVTIQAGDGSIRYYGTKAQTDLYVYLYDDHVTLVEYGDEVFGEVVGCEHLPPEDGIERADCPVVEGLSIYVGGGRTTNSVVIENVSNYTLKGIKTVGSRGADTVDHGRDSTARSSFYGGGGDDYFVGSDGRDLVEGGVGDDYVAGEGSHDKLVGQRGDDHLAGGDGADTVIGRKDSDVLYGGPGRDTVMGKENGTKGDDDLNCGPGRDTATKDWRDLAIRCEDFVE